MKAGRRNLSWMIKSIGAGLIPIIAIVICLKAVQKQ
jgi:hypothetical protein